MQAFCWKPPTGSKKGEQQEQYGGKVATFKKERQHAKNNVARRGSAEEDSEVRKRRDRVTGAWKQIS